MASKFSLATGYPSERLARIAKRLRRRHPGANGAAMRDAITEAEDCLGQVISLLDDELYASARGELLALVEQFNEEVERGQCANVAATGLLIAR